MSVAAAQALTKRLEPFPNASLSEVWCGDCAEAIQHIRIPSGSLTFAFIDPTGIGHAPFSLIETLHRKTRCDLLINIQHGMGIKMNIHQYTPEAERRVGIDQVSWATMPGRAFRATMPESSSLACLTCYKGQLDRLGFSFIGREVLISNRQGVGLYLLLYASKHARGAEFWEKTRRGVLDPELDFGM